MLRIVDTGSAPGTNLVAAVTLATALSTLTSASAASTSYARPSSPAVPGCPSQCCHHDDQWKRQCHLHRAGHRSFGTNIVTYQWYLNTTTPLTNQITSTLTILSVATNLTGNTYDCVASDAFGSVTSAVATLTVNFVAQSPVITNAPANVSAHVNDNVTFASITPSGTTPFNFQWYFNGTALSDGDKYTNSQTSALTIFGATTDDSGNYYLVASNDQGAACFQSCGHTLGLLRRAGHQRCWPTSIGRQPLSVLTVAAEPAVVTTAGTHTADLSMVSEWFGTNALSDINDYSGSATMTL